ncbi:hypothetical protein EV421DRAFT_1840832 [Armillaria borealis]|uniref:Uncharacterized protein n=1 Tax=Armillaria borealis TaxID=47425 RepID=A0AA39MHW9_9AGAR|nr:hypothetical protein EV421DRAFT_1840832 [Armillaria borealis]
MSGSDWVPISDASDWPLELTSLSRLLNPRIPLELADGTCTLTSPRSSELLDEIATQFKGSPGVFSDAHGDSPALLMLNLILSTVAALRAISDMSMNGIPRPTTPFWSLLLRSLVITCYEKSYILENVSFALSKPLDPNCTVLDGHASLLVSHLADQLQPPRTAVASQAADDPSSITERHAVESNYGESGCSLSDGDESLSEHSVENSSYESMETSTQPTSAPSSNIPVEAHVLSHWRQPDCVALPFLCIADEGNIISLIKSTVYQRYTWGISEPVVGMILSETGCIGRVVMGWTDEPSDSDHVLPRIRIAYSDGRCPNSSLGIYDLTDPISTIQLAQFILSLRQHIEKIVSTSSSPTFRPVLWRSDSIQMDEDLSGPDDQRERRIHIWLRGVPSPPQSDSASESIDPPPTSEITDMSKPSKSSKKSASTSQSSLKPPVDEKQRSPSHGSSIVSSASTRAKAASMMAKVPEAGVADGDPLSIGSFLYDRNAFSVARLPLIEVKAKRLGEFMEEEDGPALSYSDNDSGIDDAQDEEVTVMARIYDDLTGYQKPSWVASPPSVDANVQNILELFMHQLEDMDSTSTTDYPSLDPSLMKIVASSLSFLLCVSVGGFAKGLSYKPNETEARHCWDLLLYISFVVSGEAVSQRLLLERHLSLPRNTALDLTSGEANNLAALQQHADALVRLCRRTEHTAFSRFKALDPIAMQAGKALGEAYVHLHEASALSQNANAAEVISKRAQEEPDNAKCDSFLAFPVSIPVSIPRRGRPEPLVRGWDHLKRRDNQPNQSPKVEETAQTKSDAEKTQRMKSPFFTNASETQNFKLTQSQLTKIVENLLGRHLISVLFGEYKKPDEEDGKAVNQCKMYMVSGVMHLKSLGITRYPVFGLATNGTVGALLCCWYSKRLDRIFIMDRNIRLFDIASPIQAYHFMTFLLRLRRWSDEQLKKHQVRILENAGAFLPDRTWTRKAQKEEAKKVLVDTTGEIGEDAEIVGQFSEMKV